MPEDLLPEGLLPDDFDLLVDFCLLPDFDLVLDVDLDFEVDFDLPELPDFECLWRVFGVAGAGAVVG